MGTRVLIYALLAITALLSVAASAEDTEFVIGGGDSLLIEVYNERDLTVRARVPKSGQLRIPLLGDVTVAGKTATQLARELEALYFDGYLVNPSVSVLIEKFRPFFIRGAVKSSGSYDYEYDLTVDKAIAIAGGLKDRASNSEWYIIRGKDKARIKVEKETKVYPGDIIEIEESLF